MAGVRMREQYLEIPARPEAAFYARRHVRRVLAEWRLDGLLDTAELIASELVTNAVKAMADGGGTGVREAPGDAAEYVWIDVYRTADLVVLEVWDSGRTPPVPRTAAPDDEGGRGLCLVDALAENWGHRRPVTGGKVVWCALRVPG
ncbi:ATP-binding protein [Sphaerisporangium sp. NPDC049002]|uniref:ATP-binding protein n=1 Tax=unclassified Sphaerisporangium TaxID=2630420 RepID=UPI003405659A